MICFASSVVADPRGTGEAMLTRKQFELLRFINERLKEAASRPPSTK